MIYIIEVLYFQVRCSSGRSRYQNHFAPSRFLYRVAVNTSVLSFWTISFEVLLYYFWEFLHLQIYALLCGQKLYKASAQYEDSSFIRVTESSCLRIVFKNFRNKEDSSSFPQRLVPTVNHNLRISLMSPVY